MSPTMNAHFFDLTLTELEKYFHLSMGERLIWCQLQATIQRRCVHQKQNQLKHSALRFQA